MRISSLPWRTMLILAVAIPLAACSRDSTRFGAPPVGGATAAPSPQVATRPLPPPGEVREAFEDEEGRFEDDRMAALPPPTEAPTRESVLGQWSVSTPNDSCQLFVALTSWEGGYRASTRGCTSPELTGVGAWNIEGDLVVLKDDDGNPVGRLTSSGASRFDGRLELGGAISMTR